MSRAMLVAVILMGVGVSAGAAQSSIGVSAVILEPVEIAEVEYQVTTRNGRLEVREERPQTRRSMVLEQTVVEPMARGGQPGRVWTERNARGDHPARSLERLDGGEPSSLLTGSLKGAGDDLVITRVIAANS